MDKIVLKHASASSVTNFVECPARWSQDRDQDRQVKQRNDFAEVGLLVHGALELCRKPENGYEWTWANLEACFKQSAADQGFAENMAVYKRAYQICQRAFQQTQTHSRLPLHMLKTIDVEIEINNWKPEGWPLPIKGFIDHAGILTPNEDEPMRVILLIEDYKTGRAKQYAELVEDDVQPPIYMRFAIEELVPYLENLGYEVIQTVLFWNYIDDGSPVTMYQADFDLDLVMEYVKNILIQQMQFTEAYNGIEEALSSSLNRDATQDELEQAIAQFLVKYEQLNRHCSWCPRKGLCQSFQRSLVTKEVVDLATADWAAIWKEREQMSSIYKFSDARKKEIDNLIRTYLDQEKLPSIQIEELGLHLTADPQERKEHLTPTLIEILGSDFVLANASITQVAVDRHLDLIALRDPDKARELRTALDTRMSRGPGARIVRGPKIPVAKKPKKGALPNSGPPE